MKKVIIIAFCFCIPLAAVSQKSSSRQVLLEQLKSTHNAKNWFVPVNTTLEGLTATQAAWKDKGNHSSGQLAYHLLFWNERQLKDFKGEKNDNFTGNNEETFDKFDQAQWANIVKRLDQVLTDIEKWVETAPEDQLAKHAGTIANISAHNAYHTGQIVTVRKAQGSWDPEKGVK
ncbi:MAG: DinB family protein [Cyclobacteriaceae bacterium]|nr:DinB family protein [Cyclobacteriaceae bacterium]